MSAYMNLSQTARGLLSTLSKFLDLTLNYVFHNKINGLFHRHSETVPISSPFRGIEPESPESRLESPEKGETNGESNLLADPAVASSANAQIEAKVDAPNPEQAVKAPGTEEAPAQPALPSPERTGNRAQRRQAAAWERARRKHDKFVQPQGPEPVYVPRGPYKPRTEKPIGEAEDTDAIVEDGELLFRESEFWGQFSFRDTILDQLERYWIYLARMKKYAPDSYEFYKRMGATVMPPIAWLLHQGTDHRRKLYKDALHRDWKLEPLSPWWKTHRPTFGCVTMGITTQIEKDELEYRDEDHPNLRLWIPKFLYFTKYKIPPAHIQPTTNGDVYNMTIWWDRPQSDAKTLAKHKGGIPEEYAVYISKDGNDVHVLPVHETEYVTVRRKKPSRGYRRGETFTIRRPHWGIPGHYTRWAKRVGTTPNILLTSIFLDAARAVERANYSVVRVAVHNKDLTAVFGVDIKRVPYFFQDRDITLTESGARKRAFHIVRPYVRKDGTAVKMTFRGERHFTWAGYQVEITIPGRDHFLPVDVNMGLDDMGSVDKKDLNQYASQKEFAEELISAMKDHVGGLKK